MKKSFYSSLKNTWSHTILPFVRAAMTRFTYFLEDLTDGPNVIRLDRGAGTNVFFTEAVGFSAKMNEKDVASCLSNLHHFVEQKQMTQKDKEKDTFYPALEKFWAAGSLPCSVTGLDKKKGEEYHFSTVKMLDGKTSVEKTYLIETIRKKRTDDENAYDTSYRSVAIGADLATVHDFIHMAAAATIFRDEDGLPMVSPSLRQGAAVMCAAKKHGQQEQSDQSDQSTSPPPPPSSAFKEPKEIFAAKGVYEDAVNKARQHLRWN